MGNRKSAPRQRKPASRSQKGFGGAQGPLVARRRKGDGGGHQRGLEALAQDVDQASQKKCTRMTAGESTRRQRCFSGLRQFANITKSRVSSPRVPFWQKCWWH